MKNYNILSEIYSSLKETSDGQYTYRSRNRCVICTSNDNSTVCVRDGRSRWWFKNVGDHDAGWYMNNGILHRTNGPAYVREGSYGYEIIEYWLNDSRYSPEAYKKWQEAQAIINKDNPGVPTEF